MSNMQQNRTHITKLFQKHSIPKKLIHRLNSCNNKNCSPSLLQNTTLNSLNAPKALFINAMLNNTNVQITIDTGANICCITHSLVPNNSLIEKETMTITGPSNKSLILIGSTYINITINSYNFKVKVFIIKNLSCALIIGNDFLSQNKARINFKDKTITLNNTIIVQMYNNDKHTNINNITESPNNLFSMTPQYAIAHSFSQDLKTNKGIALSIKNTYGDTTQQLAKIKPTIGQTIPITINNVINIT